MCFEHLFRARLVLMSYLYNVSSPPLRAEMLCPTLQREDGGSETQAPCSKPLTTEPPVEDTRALCGGHQPVLVFSLMRGTLFFQLKRAGRSFGVRARGDPEPYPPPHPPSLPCCCLLKEPLATCDHLCQNLNECDEIKLKPQVPICTNHISSV